MNNLKFFNIPPNNNFNTNIVSKNVDNYFNNLLNNINPYEIKKTKTSNFYNDYIEHNILLIFIIAAVAIFLFFRYYLKEDPNDYDEDYPENLKNKYDEKNDNFKKYKPKKFKKIKKIKKNNNHSYNDYTIDDAKKELEHEKSKILKIIDELSTMNYENTSLFIDDNNSNLENFTPSKTINKQNYNNNQNNIQEYRKEYYDIQDFVKEDPINKFKDDDSTISFRSNDPINNMYMNRNHQFYEVDNKININSNVSSGGNFVPKLAQNNFKELSKNSIENISDDLQMENPYY